jgi:hypothetical protein
MRNIEDYSKITDIEFDGIDHSDDPDYSDAYIESAKYDGAEMTEEEIESLDTCWVHETLWNHIH